jgi:hypothetical protein
MLASIFADLREFISRIYEKITLSIRVKCLEIYLAARNSTVEASRSILKNYLV